MGEGEQAGGFQLGEISTRLSGYRIPAKTDKPRNFDIVGGEVLTVE